MKINVLDFGAKGQNRLLDTWGIQRALNQAQKGPITVYILAVLIISQKH